MNFAGMKPFGPPLRVDPNQPSPLDKSAITTAGSGAAVQMEPRRPKDRIVRVEVNSNDRDVCGYPSPADFVWSFPFPLKNVKSICLVGGTFPVPFYNVDSPFNTFTFDTGAAKVSVTFPPGVYTAASLASKTAALLTAADGVNTYTAAIDPVTQRISITTSGVNTFGFLFGTGNYLNEYSPGLKKIQNPSAILGFVDSDAYSDGGVLVAPYPVNLTPLTRMYVYLNYDATMDLRSVLRGMGKHEPSGILYCNDADTATNSIKTLNRDTYDNLLAPNLTIPRIRTLHVSLRDEFYNVINTNNRPVSLLLEIIVSDAQER